MKDIPPGERDKWITWEIGEEVEVKGCIFKIIRVKTVRKQIYLEYVCRTDKETVMTQEGRDEFMKVITERLADTLHQLWMERVKKEGRHAPKDCPHERKACAVCMGVELYGSSDVTGSREDLVKCNDCGNVQQKTDRHDCEGCHPCMVPYNELPENKKMMDRDYPQTLFNILDEMGFRVVRKQ
jgi:hypothetical protein